MVDLWEVIGRLVTNDAFRTSMLANLPVPAKKYDVDTPSHGWVIPEPDYTATRAEVAKVIKQRPLSLFSAGELRLVMSNQDARDRLSDLAKAVMGSGVNTANRSDLFYVALGAMILDDLLRDNFIQGGVNGFDNLQFGALTQAERADILTLGPIGGPVRAAARQFCLLIWDPACNCKFNFYNRHTHPVENLPQPS